MNSQLRRILMLTMSLVLPLMALTVGLVMAQGGGNLFRVTTTRFGVGGGFPSLSADGTKVAFSSSFDFLGEGASLPTGQLLWVYNTATLTVTRIPFANSGDEDRYISDISADGSKVVFVIQRDAGTSHNIWLYDALTMAFTHVTSHAAPSTSPSLSADGTKIAFDSSFDLLQGVSLNQSEIWLYDTATMTVTRVTTASGASGFRDSFNPSLSADGTKIAFNSESDFLSQGIPQNQSEIWLYDTATMTVTRVTTASGTGSRSSFTPRLSADKMKITFISDSDFLNQGIPDEQYEVWLYDTATMTVTRVTTASDGNRDSGFAGSLDINMDGSKLAFVSDSDFLGQGIPDAQREIWLYDTATMTVTRITTASDGNRSSFDPSLNADGTKLAFKSDSDLLGQGIEQFQFEIWLYDASPLQVIATNPAGNGRVISPSEVISASFSEVLSTSTVTSGTFTIRGQQTGIYDGNFTVGSILFDATNDFKPGEEVVANLSTGIFSIDNSALLTPFAWQFWAAVGSGNGSYSLKQSTGSLSSFEVALGDLDNDTDLDAFIVNASALNSSGGQPNKVWLNTNGTFADSGQSLSNEASTGVALGDLDNDGDLDAFVTNWGQKNHVLRNGQGGDPLGTFSLSADNGHNLGNPNQSRAVALADLNGDGHLDAFVANEGSSNTIWLNDGDGTAHFSPGQVLPGSANSWDVALGDIDGDGDFDAFVVNHDQADEIWLNSGSGTFSLDQSLSGSNLSRAVALGDVDGDGDLDAVSAYGLGLGQPNKLWRNTNGTFIDSGQSIGDANSWAVALGDVDADNDLDAVFGNLDANKIWRNDGNGIFTDSGQNLGDSTTFGLILGDVDGSGALAIFTANTDNGPNKLWLNESFTGTHQIYLPLIHNSDLITTELFIKSSNTNGISLVEVRDPNTNALLLSCSNIGNNVTELCGTFPSIGSYVVTAQATKCGLLGPVTFHDANGGTITRSVWCN